MPPNPLPCIGTLLSFKATELFKTYRQADTAIVSVVGAVNSANAASFRDVLYTAVDSFTNHLIVTLDKCIYVDSSAINELIYMQKLLAVPVTVVLHFEQFLNRRFSVSELQKQLRIVHTLDDALRIKDKYAQSALSEQL